MVKLIAVQLETCHHNNDGTAWYGYFDGEIDNVEPYKEEIRQKAKSDGAPLGCDFENDEELEPVPNLLSKHTGLFRYYVAGAA
jgi:hypothetical protein